MTGYIVTVVVFLLLLPFIIPYMSDAFNAFDYMSTRFLRRRYNPIEWYIRYMEWVWRKIGK